MRLMIFPAAIMANTFAMMLVMIGLSVFGKPALAADFGLIHGATVALFYSFSGNARSLILGAEGLRYCPRILCLRLILLIPLSALAWVLSIGVVDGGGFFVLLLVLRRAAEWLAEIFLSEQEVQQQDRAALNFFLGQTFFSLLVLAALLLGDGWALPATLLWAASPLLACRQGALLRQALKGDGEVLESARVMLPHFGSTAVIGISVYMFRLFLLLVSGKVVAGDLFSAFALGGILGAVFSQALGPSMVREEQTQVSSPLVRLFSRLLVALALLGLGLGAMLWSLPGVLDWTGKNDLFWQAVACSLVGGVVMVLAQKIRLRIIQGRGTADVFGSDILANIVLVASVPFLFFAVGQGALVSLHLLSGLLSLFFYSSERCGLLSFGPAGHRSERWLLTGLALLVMVPLFFQLNGGLFVDTSAYFNSGGDLVVLPLPISLAACFMGIVLLGRYSEARLALVMLFFLFVGMLFVSLSLEGADKLILLVQFIVPVFALVLGQQFGQRSDPLRYVAVAGLALLLVLVPLQLIATWTSGIGHLSPSVFLFSIYGHLQYVPVVLVGVFLVCLFALAQVRAYLPWLMFLVAAMGAYVVFSVSMLAQGLMVLGVLGFIAKQLHERHARICVTALAALVLGGGAALVQVIDGPLARHKYSLDTPPVDQVPAGRPAIEADSRASGLEQNAQPDHGLASAKNLLERRELWHFYSEQVLSGWKPLLFGHPDIPNRERYPSAHNYYLDFVYHFGLIGLIPLLVLLVYTLVLVLRRLDYVWRHSELLGLAGVVVFFLVVDNFFKVGLRQPYPGILTFFLWGILLAQLRRPAATAQGSLLARSPASPAHAQ